MTPYNDVRFGLLGGSIVDANALLRSYIWHCIGIPIVASVLMIVHFWRVRKDGGISGPAPVMLEAEADKPRKGRRRRETAEPLRRRNRLIPETSDTRGMTELYVTIRSVTGKFMDWQQLWEIASAPDNVPIVG